METSLDKSASDLRDKRLFTANFDKISEVDLTAKKQTIEFGRSKDAWQIVKPRPLRADNFSVEDLVRKLKDAKMDLSAAADTDEKKIAGLFASGTPVATAKVTDATGTQTLEVRKNKSDYYAKSSAVSGVYKVAADLGTGLDKALDDFRNKKLFDFGFDDVSAVGDQAWAGMALAQLYKHQIAWMPEVQPGSGDAVLRACMTSLRTTEQDIEWVSGEMSRILNDTNQFS